MEEFGYIGPWLEQSNQLPRHFFNRRTKMNKPLRDQRRMMNLNRTEVAVLRKLKTQPNSITFKCDKPNEARVITLNLGIRDEHFSNLSLHNISFIKLQDPAKTHKKTSRAYSMSTVKKKPRGLYDLPHGQSEPSQTKPRKSNKRAMSASHFLAQQRTVPSQSDHTKSLQVCKVDLKTLPVPDGPDFFREVASVWKQKNKILGRHSQSGQDKVEREVFRNRNRKFKSWQKLKKKMGASASHANAI